MTEKIIWQNQKVNNEENKIEHLNPVANIKEMVKLYNEHSFIERPTETFKILKKRIEGSVVEKENADVLLSLLMQRLVWADPDKVGKTESSSDLRLEVWEYPVYEIKAQWWMHRETRSPIITPELMDLFLDAIVPPHIENNLVNIKTERRTDIDEDFSASLNVNVNFDYIEAKNEPKEDKWTHNSLYSSKPQFLIENDWSALTTLSRYRVNLTKVMWHPLLVIRKIDAEIPDFFKLWLNSRFLQFITYDRGLVLVTGPTWSWKSTTLAAIINEINKNYRKHIITLENPVEFVHKNNKSFFTQRDIPSDSFSFERAQKSALRQWPDIILFWEMRDPETISWALEMAETWHLVFWTLHTFNAAKTIDRLIGSYPIEWQQQIANQLSTAFLGCIAQTLIKTVDWGITALNEMVITSDSIKWAIAENDSKKITQIADSNPVDHLSMVNHALQLIKEWKVSQNAVFWKIYRESKEFYTELKMKLETARIYDPENDDYTPSAIKRREEEEILRLEQLNNKQKEEEKNISETGKIEKQLNEQEKNNWENKSWLII